MSQRHPLHREPGKQYGRQRGPLAPRADSPSRHSPSECSGFRPTFAALAMREDGMMSMVNVVTVAFLALLIGFVANVGRIVQEKIAVQNAADAAAYSASAVMARGMNAVTATNHLMGE